ncbi:hypothetical protein MUK42_18242 [Musa troglodytarum]|uniref:Autophagy-related protein 101 n=1 Tax=Musa troglodytarum TaxID=320322 RepID=A0A9E7HFE1_9LILI|nr:hypothetical protein MUK42_18242 [Musa troglodytarum]
MRCVVYCIQLSSIEHQDLFKPKDVECEHFEITYPSYPEAFLQVRCGDHEIEKKIDEKIDQFVGWVEKHPNRKGQVTPFLNVFHSSSDSSFGWHADVLKRMLQTGHPSMLS